MEFALNEDKKRIHATDADKECEYFCPLCGGLVIPRQGEVNAWHFAHQTSCVDDWKYDMSEWHRAWQERFPVEARGYADYRRFYIDDSFCPDLFSNTGLRDILLNKRKRFDAFLRDHAVSAFYC